MTHTIVVAVSDPVLHPEVMHIAAATSAAIVDLSDPAEIVRYSRVADALLIDAEVAGFLSEMPNRDHVYLVVHDPGPIDWKLALRCGAHDAFVIPAQSPELLRELGGAVSSSRKSSRPGKRGDGDTDGNRRAIADSSPGNTLGIIPAVGGAGASTLAVALAHNAEQAVLVDAVPHSGGLDLLLGAESELGARWGDVHFGAGSIAVSDIVRALPAVSAAQGISVLTSSRGMVGESAPTLSDARGALDSLSGADVVVDLPRWSEFTAEVAALCTALLVVVPAEIRAMSAAAEVGTQLRKRLSATPVCAVLRHRGWSGLDLDEAQRLSHLDFIGEVPHCAGLAKQAETTGILKVPRGLRKLADDVLADPRMWTC